MTENPEKTIDPVEYIPSIEQDSGKIQEQAQKQAANFDGPIELLQTGKLLDRTKVADILGEIGDSRAIGPLLRLLQDPKKDVHTEADTALELPGIKKSS